MGCILFIQQQNRKKIVSSPEWYIFVLLYFPRPCLTAMLNIIQQNQTWTFPSMFPQVTGTLIRMFKSNTSFLRWFDMVFLFVDTKFFDWLLLSNIFICFTSNGIKKFHKKLRWLWTINSEDTNEWYKLDL